MFPTDDAEEFGYAGCEPFGPHDDYDPMYAGPDDRHWKEDMAEDMPQGFGMLGKWDCGPKQVVTRSMRFWAERYWTKLVDECPSPDREDVDKARRLFERWAKWAKKVTTSNRKKA